MDKKESKFRIFRNNAYAVKTVWSISKERVISTALDTVFDYAGWIFFSIFFLRFVIGAIENEKSFGEIMLFLGISAIVFGFFAIYNNYLNAMVYRYTDNEIYRNLYKRLYAKARNVELRCFEDAAFYDKYTMALDNAAWKMTEAVKDFFRVLFGIIAAGVGFSSMFFLDKLSILFVVFPILGNFLFGYLMSKIYSGKYEDNVKNVRRDGYVNRVMHLAEFAKEVRYSNVHRLMMKRYRESVEGTIKVADKYAPKAIIFNWFKNVLTFAVPFEGIMIYAAFRAIISQSLGLAELAIMFTAMVTCSWILIGLFENVQSALKNGRFLEYFRGFMEYEEKIPENGDGLMPDKNVKSIEFRNVSFGYAKDDKIIDNLSFKIEGNIKTTALVGHNGAGKTTIIKLLFRLYDPTTGEIFVNGINIKEYNLKAYRKLFAAAFQDYKAISMPVRDNVLMGVKFDGEDEIEIVENALKRAGILEKIKSLPKGIDTVLTKEFDEDGAVLSGGEVQKIIVARAFAQRSSVKVFDEPSSALDPIAEYQLYKGIMKESRESDLTIFISHRLSSVKDADLVFMLEKGAIIEQGTHLELMENKGEYCKMFTMQAQNYLAVEDYSSFKEVTAV
ncbi:MAG: ABC transporter ATP-binding protein/permease [Oscillospiraceae bacterium]|nr:ABC transporter ATP-binding protein/permease [Oscillospiraceae bacterium]